MALWTFTLFITAVCVLYFYLKKQLDYFKNRGVPYVPGWPLLGNMAAPLFQRQHISEKIREIYNTYPDAKYVGMFDFMRPVIMLRDPDLIKSVAIKNFDSFPDHQSFVDAKVDPIFGGGLLNIAGDRWKEIRALLTPAFTSSKMKAMYELMAECVFNFMNYLDELPNSDKVMVDSKDIFTRLTSDIIANCAFGMSVDSFKNPKNQFYMFGCEAMDFEGIKSMKWLMGRAFPDLMKWFKVKFVNDRVAEFFKNIIRETVETRDTKGISRPDMIQLMMNARNKTGDNVKLNITDMTAQAFIFFFGGFDSTSTQMSILAHELANHSDIQKRLQDEIDEVMERSNGCPSYEDIQGMMYLDAVFNESTRQHTQDSSIDRLCTKDFELPPAVPGAQPFSIRPGMSVWIPTSAVHKDPQYHHDPDKFNPDRFYGKKFTINDITNLGFGIGPRGCIGYRFATLEIKILLVHLLSKFNLLPNEKTCKPLKYSKTSFFISAEGGFWLTIQPRKKN